MKSAVFTLLGIITTFSAHAASPEYTGKTICNGVVKTSSSDSSPIKLEIEWGPVETEPGNLPPYWIHQKQAATVMIGVEGNTGTESILFNQSGGTTRCEWWDKSVGMVVLYGGLYSYYLEFDHSWNHSCNGSEPTGAYLSDTLPGGPNQKIKLSCY